MMLVSGGPITGGGKGGGCRLERRVVRDVHPPVRTESFSGAVGEIAIDHGQEIPNLVRACPMTLQPTVPLPVWQGHPVLPARTSVPPARRRSGNAVESASSRETPRADTPWDSRPDPDDAGPAPTRSPPRRRTRHP